ncbi:MAG: HD domain-containing protein [Candidatus Andersenbacteria bacterium]|nr:HD domain-containing protein [Candidatus Andersenbacteria bacterium]MBI3250693.1 HD domain-containing protein [Candidatus Andersenbacteria bacterium]
MSKDLSAIVNFLFEVGMLAKTPRSGFHFLTNHKQSVAEHINRTAYIGYVLAMMEDDDKVDPATVMKMCLLHDLAEARTSDLNWMNQKYVTAHEEKAVHDLVQNLPFGEDIKKTIDTYEERTSLESKLAKDADILELLLVLKEMIDVGHKKAKTWIPPMHKRLQTKSGRKLAKVIMKTDSDNWWYGNKKDTWWINRNGKDKLSSKK